MLKEGYYGPALDPNIAYMILVVGFVLVCWRYFTPDGLLEVGVLLRSYWQLRVSSDNRKLVGALSYWRSA